MVKTEKFDGLEFKLKNGLFVPKQYVKEFSIKDALKKAVATLVTAGVLLTPVIGSANDSNAEKPNTLFAGSIVSDSGENTGVNNILKSDLEDGSNLTVEQIATPFAEDQTNQLNLGMKFPLNVLSKNLSLVVGVDYNTIANLKLGSIGFAQFKPRDEVTLRAGSYRMPTEEGFFYGMKISPKFVTVDFDVRKSKGQPKINGYVSSTVGDNVQKYLSVGIKSEEEMNLIQGIFQKGGFGLYNKINVKKEVGSTGNIVLIPTGMTKGRGSYDFRNHLYNGTELMGIATGYTRDGWAPFDASYTDGEKGHFVVSSNWSATKDVKGAKATLFYKPIPTLFLGLGAGDYFDVQTGVHNPTGSLEIATELHPLEAWVKLERDMKTGQVTPTGYVGVLQKF